MHARVLIERSHGPTREVDIFNLHLGLSARERTRQVGELVRSREYQDVPEGAACFIVGDFNDWLFQLHPIFIEILGFRSATGDRFGYPASIRTYPSFSPTGALDRIYFRGPLKLIGARGCRLAVSRVASDHLPIVAEFEVT
jgi:endonuclease/exonuclease/phosphatase family metal-dependent hydrolase